MKIECENKESSQGIENDKNILQALSGFITTLETGPCGIPENTGIPGLDSNTDTGIFENKIPVFFGILV